MIGQQEMITGCFKSCGSKLLAAADLKALPPGTLSRFGDVVDVSDSGFPWGVEMYGWIPELREATASINK